MAGVLRYRVLDTETTGAVGTTNDAAGSLIQLSVFDSTGEHFDEHCQPEKPIIPAALAVHGITNEVASTFPPIERLRTQFQQYRDLRGYSAPYIAHNAQFDVDVLAASGISLGQDTICTLRMARKLIPLYLVGNHKLDTLHVYFFPEQQDITELMELRARHDALDDCWLTAKIFLMMLPLLNEQFPEVDSSSLGAIAEWAHLPRFLEAWPLGKHKGKPLDHDWGYAQWYLGVDNPDRDILYTLKTLKERHKKSRKGFGK